MQNFVGACSTKQLGHTVGLHLQNLIPCMLIQTHASDTHSEEGNQIAQFHPAQRFGKPRTKDTNSSPLFLHNIRDKPGKKIL